MSQIFLLKASSRHFMMTKNANRERVDFTYEDILKNVVT